MQVYSDLTTDSVVFGFKAACGARGLMRDEEAWLIRMP